WVRVRTARYGLDWGSQSRDFSLISTELDPGAPGLTRRASFDVALFGLFPEIGIGENGETLRNG
ncbi:MAG: hypothetical protein ACXVBC_13885, partial [Bdellovibrionota bacterium]